MISPLKFENKVLSYIEKNKVIFSIILISIVALVLRFNLYEYESGDFALCIEPSFNELKERWRIFSIENRDRRL